MNKRRAFAIGYTVALKKQAEMTPMDHSRMGNILMALTGGGAALGGLRGATRERTDKEKKSNKSRLKMILGGMLSGAARLGGAGAAGVGLGSLATGSGFGGALRDVGGTIEQGIGNVVNPLSDRLGAAWSGLTGNKG